MRCNDAITGSLLVIFALAEVAYTRTFPSLYGQAYGPDLFPVLIGVALAVCGVAPIVRGIAHRRAILTASTDEMIAASEWVECGDWVRDPRIRTNVVLVLASLVAYITGSTYIGFVLISCGILTVLLYRFGSSWLVSVGCALLTTLVLQLLFAKALLVPLPPGWLLGIVW